MFVASNLYRYATGSGSSTTAGETTAAEANTRVKRRPNRRPPHSYGPDPPPEDKESSPPPSYASVASGSTPQEQKQANEAKYAIIETLLQEEDLYKLLGIKRNAKMDEIRRGFLNRSRICHPDKFQNYPPATEAFQKVSFAYEILSKPTSRRMYDVSGKRSFAAAMSSGGGNGNDDDAGLADDTLNGVLYSVFCEFMEGDFEMIRVMVNALNEGNPSMNLGDDAVDSIEGAFRKLREAMLAGRRYLSIIKFELIRLYEIQQSLRQLSYFNITGRLKLTLQLARVTINIPLAIDQAMKTGGVQEAEEPQSHNQDYASSSSDEDSEADEPQSQFGATGASQRSNAAAADADFGVAPEGDGGNDDDDSDSAVHSESLAEERARARRRAKRARRRAAKREQRAKLRGGSAADADAGTRGSSNTPNVNDKQLQRRGLLPQTAVGLLKGVVMVLETSEGWMPGGGVSGSGSSEK